MDPGTLQGLIGLIGGLGSLGSTGGNIYGSLLTKQLVDQILGGKTNVLNNLNNLQQGAQGNINQLQGPLVNLLSGVSNFGGQGFQNLQGGLQGYLNQALSGTGAFGQQIDPNSIPGLSQYLQESGGITSHGNTMGNVAAQFGIGGTAGQAPLLGAGSSLLTGNTPNSAFQQLLQDAASKNIGAGGYTEPLNTVSQFGQSLLNPNPLAQQASGLASQIFGGGPPVLPMNQAISLATNQSATQSQQQEDDLRRQLLDRTGVTGPAVASGSQNELLNNLGNQALQNQSKAVTDTILGQQGLGLQQTGLGNALLSGATGANLGYQGQGLNAMLQSAGQAGQLQNILGNLGLGGGSLGLNTLSTGGNLLNAFNQSALGGLNADTSNLNALNAINQGLAGTSFGAQNLNQEQLKNMYSSLLGSIGQGNTMSGQNLQALMQGSQIPSSILQDYIQQLTQGGTSQVGLYSQTPQYPPNFMQNLLSGGGGAVNPGIGLGFNFGGGGGGPAFNFGGGGFDLGGLGNLGGGDPFGLGNLFNGVGGYFGY